VYDCPQSSENGKPLTLALSGVEFTPTARYVTGGTAKQSMNEWPAQTLRDISKIGGSHDSAI
jgi:hypothetical protein